LKISSKEQQKRRGEALTETPRSVGANYKRKTSRGRGGALLGTEGDKKKKKKKGKITRGGRRNKERVNKRRPKTIEKGGSTRNMSTEKGCLWDWRQGGTTPKRGKKENLESDERGLLEANWAAKPALRGEVLLRGKRCIRGRK